MTRQLTNDELSEAVARLVGYFLSTDNNGPGYGVLVHHPDDEGDELRMAWPPYATDGRLMLELMEKYKMWLICYGDHAQAGKRRAIESAATPERAVALVVLAMEGGK